MKKILLVSIMSFCMLFLVGCIDADVTIDLDMDGTGKAIIEVKGPKLIFNNIPESGINSLSKDYEKVEKINEDNKYGYRFTTKKGDLMQILQDVTEVNDSINPNAKDSQSSLNTGDSSFIATSVRAPEEEEKTGMISNIIGSVVELPSVLASELYDRYVKIEEEDGIFSTTYDVKLNIKDAIYNEMRLEQKAVLNIVGSGLNVGLHIKSPIEAESTNATNVTKEDGKHVYSWEYQLSNIKNIEFSAKIPKVERLAMAAGAVLVVLLIIIFSIRRKIKKRRATK